MKKEKIGIYGGSFSPPHIGHVRAAEIFFREMQLDRLLIMPANIPPHKQIKGSVPAQARYELCCAAFADLRGIQVSDYEITKQGVSYTVDTLRHFAADGRELYLLCGDDMFLTLDTWREPEEIFRLCHVVSMRRYEDGAEKLTEKGAEYEERYGARVHFIVSEPFPVSSTQVRELIASGTTANGYVPPAVLDEIGRMGLYGSGEKEVHNV